MQGGQASLAMSIQRGPLALAAICALFVLLSLAGLAAAFLSLSLSLDGLLLIMICLMMGGLFSLLLFQMAREMGWLPARRKKQEAPAAAAGPDVAKKGEGK